MKLNKRRSFDDEYVCELTKALDEISVYDCDEDSLFCSYIYDVRDSYDRNLFAIRYPGRTIGDLEVDDNMRIINAFVCSECFDRFNSNPNEMLKKFIGRKLEIDGESDKVIL